MSEYDYDLFVIGAGSGGVRAARLAAQCGMKVAVAEEKHLGGTCVNVGCVPKKLMVYAAHVRDELTDAAGYGWMIGESRFDWPTFIANKNREIQRLNGIYENLLTDAGVTILDGRATFRDAHTLIVGDQPVTAERILIAVGAHPFVPDIPGHELTITSDEAFYLETQPRHVTIVGGGYIGVEFAGIFHGMGSDVTQLYRGPLFLRGFDEELRRMLADQMIARGIDLRHDINIEKIEKLDSGKLQATLTDGSTLQTDVIMMATGRVPNTHGLGLDAIDLDTARNGAIMVDEYSRTHIDHIHAVGDCTDRMNLTPVAIAEAVAFVRTVYEDQPTKMHYRDIPTAVFSSPPMAGVGLIESEAREEYPQLDVYRSVFRPMKYTLAGRDEKALMKLLVDGETDRVVGAHMIGPDSAEIIQPLAIALRAGLTKKDFDATIALHPTSAEEFVTMRKKS